MAHRNRRMAAQAIRVLDVAPGEAVLEISFGPGVGIQRLAETTPARWIAGIDPSRQMLEQAEIRNAGSIRAGRVTLRQNAVDGLSFGNGRFDKAMAIRSVQLWPDSVAGLREVRRVLRPGGRIVLGFTRRCESSSQDVMRWLDAAGFADPQTIKARGAFYLRAKRPYEEKPPQ